MSSDLHAVWLDKGWWLTPNGSRRLLSWNAGTHELAFQPFTHWEEPPKILAVIPDEETVHRLLDGWQDHCDTKEGLGWLAQRLEGYR